MGCDMKIIFVVALVASATTAMAGETFWPSYMSRLFPNAPGSVVETPLPEDIHLEAPGADVPPARTKWAGYWSGWACQNGICKTRMVVESVTASGAIIAVSFTVPKTTGFPEGKVVMERADAKFDGDELIATSPNQEKVAYRFRTDSVVEFISTGMITSSGSVGGMLTRDPAKTP
jgi:hypothetical protein